MEHKKVLFAELSLVIITIIWGLGFPITKLAVNAGFETNTIMVGRFLIASVLLSIVFRRKLKFIDKRIIKYGIITGLFLFFGFYFQTLGNAYTTPSKNGFITQLNIVFVPFLYFLFFKKRVDIYNMIGVGIAIVGMLFLSYNPSNFTQINIGDFYTFICAIMIAFHVVTGSFYQKKFDFDPALFVIINIYTSAILSVGAMVFFDTIPEFSVVDLWPLVFLGVLNTALGFLVQSYALKISLPTRVSLIVALESVFAVIGSVLIIKEVLTIQLVFGGLLIITAVLINEVKPFHNKNIEIV